VLSLMTDDVVFLVAGQEPFGKQKFAAGPAGACRHRTAENRRTQ
jgi:ketosteroid isomerase-like protein